MGQTDTIKSIYTYDDQETFYLQGAIPFVCTDKFYVRCTDLNIHAEKMIEQLHGQRVFLMSFAYNNTDYIDVLTQDAILRCAINEDDEFVITTLLEKTVSKQNFFIKSALKVRVTERATFKNVNNELMNDIDPREAAENFGMIKDSFLERLHTVTVVENDEFIDEDYTLSDEFESLLTLTENYVTAEDGVQRSLAQSGPMISYYKVEAASDYKRVDKLAYQFLLSDVDEKVYNVGSKVQLGLENGETESGTIIELFAEEQPFQITILFDEIFQADLIPPVGTISLEYNTVMREVRLNVIEDLRNGKTPATYLNKIIGEHSFSGFRELDLTNLQERLSKEKYPPNQSQMDAIERGIKTNDMMLVLGPPGTGKTTVILEWVKYFVLEENKRVLISSQNNKAVDNVLERLMEEKEIDTIRVGNEEKVQGNVQHLMYEERAYELQQQINEANAFYIKKVATIKQNAEELKNLIEELIPSAQLMQVANKMLEKLYDEFHTTYTTPLFQLMKLDNEQKLKLIELRKRFIEARKYLRTYETYDWFKKTYTSFKALREWIYLKTIPLRHQPLEKENSETVAKYNELIHAKNHFIDEELTLVKESFQTLNRRFKEGIEKVSSIPLTDVFDREFTLQFDHLSIERSYTDLQTMLNRLTSFYEQHEKLHETLERWRNLLSEKKNYALTKILLESVDLVGATCIGINSQRRFQDLDFDVTIIDEAGQIQIQNAIVPMSRAPKTIMLGDHLQIPPIADKKVIERVEESGMDTSLLQKSFFEYLYDMFPDENKILLDTQYRMPAEIAELLSEWFYEGNYRSFAGKQHLDPIFPQLFEKPFVLLDTSKERNRFETAIPNKGYFNKVEADQIVNIIRKTVKEVNEDLDDERLLPIKDVGVITPYTQQVKYIREKLLEAFPTLSKEMVQECVASLDSFQGQERKMIIYSCTRSNRWNPSSARIGFLKELRRLNVALSRCQEQLVFIGDIPFLSSCEYEETDEYGQQIVDDFGNPLSGKSEKEFSEFIRLMVDYAKRGKAQYIYTNEWL